MVKKPSKKEINFVEQISKKVSRKRKAKRHARLIIWSGLGMMGLIGWSVAAPTLLGVALGHILDMHYPGKHSWTLMLLIIGLILGCVNAWYWVAKEDKEIQKEQKNHDDD
ncbi:AtpZ/AtpI family protein [Legionella anisa]|uniref:F0F1 ATP synthase subunit n=1 Tax=Legionella anisa TaxID=28082 RepID=A0AAX0WZV5_9GAMM|nr:AtpZ/AtpI family protein [Legionella anisa]KTC68629.1 ATP synthase protein I [Legionella anisa]MBN5937615.1 AtpZ/AtpI family protein [Legionella anisa]PNL73972.1 F0F1 ATP synthase subunit [Legionella anisa]UAK81484.1 AtpZ/AtpI family protein [Legionella anisa]